MSASARSGTSSPQRSDGNETYTPPNPQARVADCAHGVCITCSDSAVAVTVRELRPGGLALVDTPEGSVEEVSVALVDAGVGDVVLVHAKEAIGVVSRS